MSAALLMKALNSPGCMAGSFSSRSISGTRVVMVSPRGSWMPERDSSTLDLPALWGHEWGVTEYGWLCRPGLLDLTPPCTDLGAHHDDSGHGNTLGSQILSDRLDRIQLFLDLAHEVVLKCAAFIRSHGWGSASQS